MERRCSAIPDHAEGADICTHRRHRCGCNDFPSRSSRGVRNWDYRYCWLRDATFTLYALNIGGYLDEAEAWRKWLVNAVAGTPSSLNIMYGLAGERRLTEINLDWLPGYENSKPVRTGNLAFAQRQLDIYGEVMDALDLGRRCGLRAESAQ